MGSPATAFPPLTPFWILPQQIWDQVSYVVSEIPSCYLLGQTHEFDLSSFAMKVDVL